MTKDVPTFSIAIPLYNKAPFIRKTLDSVINQTFGNYEVIVVDDGSTDGSVDIVKNEYKTPNLKVFKKANGGPSSARNRAVREAKGEWVLLLDADDLLMPYALDAFDKAINRYPEANYIVGNYYLMASDKNVTIGLQRKLEGRLFDSFYYESTRELTETSGTTIIKRDLLIEEPFDEKLWRFEDAERQYRLMRKSPVYMFHTPVSIINMAAAAASFPRVNPQEDFVCNMVFSGKSFWEKMSLYLLSKDCKRNYPDKYNELYSREVKRIPILIGAFYLFLLKKIRALLERTVCRKKTYTITDLLH